MLKFLKKSIMEAADTVYKLANIPVADTKNHKPIIGIHVGLLQKYLTTMVKNQL